MSDHINNHFHPPGTDPIAPPAGARRFDLSNDQLAEAVLEYIQKHFTRDFDQLTNVWQLEPDAADGRVIAVQCYVWREE